MPLNVQRALDGTLPALCVSAFIRPAPNGYWALRLVLTDGSDPTPLSSEVYEALTMLELQDVLDAQLGLLN